MMSNIENEFKKWLQNKVNTIAPLSSYPNAIKKLIPEKLKQINEYKYNNLFNCTDIEYLQKLLQRLKKNGDLHQFNIDTQSRVPSASISKYIEFLEDNNTNELDSKIQVHSLNQILYGPPGTGKTYNTINKTLEIIDNEFYQENKDDRTKLTNKFKELKEEGQIEFITFHQSYGYEEFVEGIRAINEDGNISYRTENGIFKKLSNKAKKNLINSKKTINQIQEEQSLEEKIRIFLNDSLENETIFTKTKGGEFKIKDLRENSILLFSNDSNYNENIIELNNDELFQILESNINFITSRQIAKEVFNIPNQRQKDTYYLAIYKIFKEFNNKHKNQQIDIMQEPLRNYILIIDEINRGNISKIFGELITLIEPSKRIGASEEIKVKLANSNDFFGVPQNLYIIGTMNTADRSIAQIDTALRRRFEFIEMLPKPDLLENIIVEEINISKILEAINERIKYIYDREHTIGHSYFMPLKETSTKVKLDEIFRVNIIPLLAEYFYGDWEDIIFILNNDFIKEKPQSKYIKDSDRVLNKVYEINDTFEVDQYIKIYE